MEANCRNFSNGGSYWIRIFLYQYVISDIYNIILLQMFIRLRGLNGSGLRTSPELPLRCAFDHPITSYKQLFSLFFLFVNQKLPKFVVKFRFLASRHIFTHLSFLAFSFGLSKHFNFSQVRFMK